VFSGSTEVARIKRSFTELIDYLTREASFPSGCFLMTGTGVVPGAEFSLEHGDSISITIDGIGTLTNTVA
jgi:2-dehydro-3-deoxy-D-arabinonate dehydratase